MSPRIRHLLDGLRPVMIACRIGRGYAHATTTTDAARRQFLAWLAATPLAAGALQAMAQTPSTVITSAEQALNVFELEAVARQTIPPSHWGYLTGGVQDDRSLVTNRTGL